MGDEEFGGGLDSDSFMAQLKADEVAVEEANKLLLVSIIILLCLTLTGGLN